MPPSAAHGRSARSAPLRDAEGYDPGDVDVVVGTSAGSVLAALTASGVPLEQVVERLSGGSAEVDGTAAVNPLDLSDSAGLRVPTAGAAAGKPGPRRPGAGPP